MHLPAHLAGRFTFPGTELSVARMGYGAMQLPGADAWGPPKDRARALSLLREAIALGVDHIDTADFYGPRVANELIREALYPYPDGLVIVSKVGFRRDLDGSWIPACSPDELRAQVEADRRTLGLDVLPIVSLRLDRKPGPLGPALQSLEALLQLREQGAIAHIALSNVSPQQVDEALGVAPIVCVQNPYNLARREDDALIGQLAARGIAYMPCRPLSDFTSAQRDELAAIARARSGTMLQVALAWLLQHSPNILVIPGTSSIEHLRENVAATSLQLPTDMVARLEAIGEPDEPD